MASTPTTPRQNQDSSTRTDGAATQLQDIVSKHEDANRIALLQLAITILADATVARLGKDSYAVLGLRGDVHVVHHFETGPICTTCSSMQDEHTSIVTLYRARIEAST